jgi:hypothetical protein
VVTYMRGSPTASRGGPMPDGAQIEPQDDRTEAGEPVGSFFIFRSDPRQRGGGGSPLAAGDVINILI